MTTPTRYRGQPVSEGIGTGEIYLGDAPGEADRGQPDPGEDDVRAAFAAVARQRAALAGRCASAARISRPGSWTSAR